VQREEQTVFTRFSRLQRTRRYRGSLILFAKPAQDHPSQLWCATEDTFTRILSVMKLTDTNEVLYSFYRAIGGQPLNPLNMDLFLPDLLQDITKVLQSVPNAQLEAWRLVLVGVFFAGTFFHARQGQHGTWAICPADMPFDKLFVAREGLNGAFVLAAPQQRAIKILPRLLPIL
jgi:hypothetical protein